MEAKLTRLATARSVGRTLKDCSPLATKSVNQLPIGGPKTAFKLSSTISLLGALLFTGVFSSKVNISAGHVGCSFTQSCFPKSPFNQSNILSDNWSFSSGFAIEFISD